jgi:hypothetical protein
MCPEHTFSASRTTSWISFRQRLAIVLRRVKGQGAMTASKAKKETLILAVAISLMAAKIMVGIILLHRWRMTAAARGEPFGDEAE